MLIRYELFYFTWIWILEFYHLNKWSKINESMKFTCAFEKKTICSLLVIEVHHYRKNISWLKLLLFFFFICDGPTQYWTISFVVGKPGTCLNFIIGNNIDRISHRKQGMRSILDLLPQRDKTARIMPHSFLSFIRGKSYRYRSIL